MGAAVTVRLLHGDCRDVFKTLPDASVHCCITSPPYWGLRSYLPAGHPDKPREIGSEPTVDEWVRVMVDVFREVRRVLRDDGTLWLNLGDSYAGGGTIGRNDAGRNLTGGGGNKAGSGNPGVQGVRPRVESLKPKDLIGQPWRVAFALQADGWYLRQEIIWAKKNPMPESVRDRFTKAHEHVFLLSKSERYYFDFDAVQEDASEGTHARLAQNIEAQIGSFRAHAGEGRGGRPMKAMAGRQPAPTPKAALASSGNDGAYSDGKSERMGRGAGWRNNASFDDAMAVMPQTRNPRSVRWLASEPFRGAHFATYPPELIRPFVLAGCPPGGTVLDPFGGSGTTGLVCDQEGRSAILIDLDERNMPMARERITADAPLFTQIEAAA